MGKYIREISIFLLLVVLCIVTTTQSPQFLSPINLQNMGKLIGIYGIFSIGVALVIITGGIDLSIGSLFALLGVLLSIALMEKKWNPVLAVGGVLGFSVVLGWVHSVLITRVKLQPFIVTLCALLLYRGLAQYIAHDETKGFGMAPGFEWLKTLANGLSFGVPNTFLLLILVAIAATILLHYSVYGRHLFAVGRNEEATRFSGINTNRVIGTAYVLCSLLAGVAAILLAFFTNSISPSSHGNSYELYGIAAAVLGGCSLRGGEGTIIGVLLGTALLQVLQNLVIMLGIPSSLNFAVVGAVILIGVIIDRLLSRRAASR